MAQLIKHHSMVLADSGSGHMWLSWGREAIEKRGGSQAQFPVGSVQEGNDPCFSPSHFFSLKSIIKKNNKKIKSTKP